MPIITLPSIVTPSYSQGFAHNKSQSASPWLWDALRGLWVSALGKTGSKLFDVSGRKNHGSLENMDSSDWAVDRRGYFVELDGISQYIDFGSSEALRILGDLTISIWIRQATSPGTMIVGYGGDAETEAKNHCYFVFPSTGTTLRYIHEYNAGVNQQVTWGGALVNDGSVWQHIVVTRDTTSKLISLYLDGTLFASPSSYTFQPTGATDATLQIGNQQGTANFWGGKISNTAIYARVLRLSEIQQLYRDPLAPLRLRDYQIPIAGEAAVGNPWYYYAQQAAIIG